MPECSKGLKEIIADTKKSIESEGVYRVVAIFNPFMVEGAWCDQSIIMVSNGKKFGKFYDSLQQLHFVGPMPRRYLNEKVA